MPIETKPSSKSKAIILTATSLCVLAGLVVGGLYVFQNTSQNIASAALPIRRDLPASTSNAPKAMDEKLSRIIIKFKDGVSEKSRVEIAKSVGAVSDHIKREELKIPGEVLVNVPASAAAKHAELIRKNSQVEYVELDEIQTFNMATNDPMTQWHHTNIKVDQAWDTTSAAGVLVAVCDTGVQKDHPDLQGNIRADLGYDVHAGSASSWDAIQHPHGTMVAGTIAATANNSVGGKGAAFSAQIMPLKVSYDATGGAYLSTLASCIKYAADKGAQVVNVSYSGVGSRSIDSAAKYANKKGTTVVFAAGNTARQENFQNYSSVIAVSATNEANQRASFSSFGRFVDLSAPGQNIATTSWNSSYATVNGTSFAAPIVSAVAAMVYHQKPGITPSQVQDILKKTADDLGSVGYDTTFGAGKVNAIKALQTN